MKILLDENLPHQLRTHIQGHEVYTVQYMEWSGIKNGRLLAVAGAAGFEAFLTIDKALPNEQNLGQLPLAIVVVNARSNKIGELLTFVPRLLVALNHLKPKAITHVT